MNCPFPDHVGDDRPLNIIEVLNHRSLSSLTIASAERLHDAAMIAKCPVSGAGKDLNVLDLFVEGISNGFQSRH